MPLPASLRRRRGTTVRLAASACLAGLAGTAAALAALGPAAPTATSADSSAVEQACLPALLTCTTSTTTTTRKTTTSTTTHTTTTTRTSRSTSASSSSSESQPGTFDTPVYVPPPDATGLPTLPPPSPGSPPQPPDLAVQTIQLDLASAPASHPGGQVLLQATLEAQRGTDTYSVPHADVSFTITSQPGAGAYVDPAKTDSGDTGIAVVTVQTGDAAGDTLVHAVSGSASADFTVHADPPSPTPSPEHGAAPLVVSTPGGNSGSRALVVAGLSALLAAMIGGYAAALMLGKLPNPLQRRVWGRRGTR